MGRSECHTGAGDATGLVELAEAVRQAAVEADSLAAAREELNDALTVTPPAPIEQPVAHLGRQ